MCHSRPIRSGLSCRIILRLILNVEVQNPQNDMNSNIGGLSTLGNA